jgi:predicted nucleotidyltransferase
MRFNYHTNEGTDKLDRAAALSRARTYAAEVCKILKPSSIIMYGSYAKDTALPESDIDIAVIFDGYDGNRLEDSALLWKLTMNVSTDIKLG